MLSSGNIVRRREVWGEGKMHARKTLFTLASMLYLHEKLFSNANRSWNVIAFNSISVSRSEILSGMRMWKFWLKWGIFLFQWSTQIRQAFRFYKFQVKIYQHRILIVSKGFHNFTQIKFSFLVILASSWWIRSTVNPLPCYGNATSIRIFEHWKNGVGDINIISSTTLTCIADLKNDRSSWTVHLNTMFCATQRMIVGICHATWHIHVSSRQSCYVELIVSWTIQSTRSVITAPFVVVRQITR